MGGAAGLKFGGTLSPISFFSFFLGLGFWRLFGRTRVIIRYLPQGQRVGRGSCTLPEEHQLRPRGNTTAIELL